MASFVDVNEYLSYYDIDGAALGRVEVSLDAACDRVRDYLSQRIDRVTNDVITLAGTNTRALLLPELPVVSVASVTLAGVPVTDYTFDSHGVLWRTAPYAWERGSNFVVTYTHGYLATEVPALVRLVAMKLARSDEVASAGVTQQSTGPFSVTYGDSATDATLAVLDQRVVRRIPVA